MPFNCKAANQMWMEEKVKPIVIQKKLQKLCNRSLLVKTDDNKFQLSEAKTAYENARKLYQAMGLDKDVEDCDKAIQDLENDDMDSD
ncbi:hypothetical protein [Pleurocapsa sp. PCC 7319]|uniref:hypothetical protein n=1 Tax=Pleurocapsa sp. PCC 7319 TaxID=118161 RepID=UPI001181B790|nr:hypothetical protein [Pleurocapsa sp. PCC 7319]